MLQVCTQNFYFRYSKSHDVSLELEQKGCKKLNLVESSLSVENRGNDTKVSEVWSRSASVVNIKRLKQ